MLKIPMPKPAFTLIELLVVIVIIGILSAISVAAFENFTEKARLAKAQSFAAQLDKVMNADTLYESENIAAAGIWNFEEGSGTNSLDLAGNDKNFTNVPGWTTQTPNASNSAVHLENTESMQTSDTSGVYYDNGSFTIAYWIYFNNDSTGINVLTLSPEGPTFGANSMLQAFTTTDTITTYIDGTTITAAYDFKPSRWYHVMVTFDGSVAKLYVDGDFIHEDSATMRSEKRGYSRIVPGYSSGLGAITLDVYLDELRIWPLAYIP